MGVEPLSKELITVRRENETNHYNLLAEKKSSNECLTALKQMVKAFKPYRKKMNIKSHFDQLLALAQGEKVIAQYEETTRASEGETA